MGMVWRVLGGLMVYWAISDAVSQHARFRYRHNSSVRNLFYFITKYAIGNLP
jgi:hypothetical protein